MKGGPFSGAPTFQIANVTDDDLEWIRRVLNLEFDSSGGDPRIEILRSTSTLDVEACPGSGKTTLLVAKLALLARQWREKRKGICVLSHTNVARSEIERRLGDVPEARRLLRHPHYVGTIHGFVNEFLALPWLRANGLIVRRIDDELADRRRRMLLPEKTRYVLERQRAGFECLRLRSADFGIGTVPWGAKGRTLGADTPTYRELRSAFDALQE